MKQIQIYKATVNAEEGRKLFKSYSQVDENMMRLRQIIIDTVRKIGVIVQPNLYSENDEAKLKTYETDFYGMIQSFVDRY